MGQLPAGAMLYTVAICLLVAMLLSAMVLLYSYAKLGSDVIYYHELAHDNLQSGKNLILYGADPNFGAFSGSLFDTSIDSYYVTMAPWGVYGILHSTGVHGPARAQESILFGQVPEATFTASLFLQDRNRPLNLAGKTTIEGLIYLPEAGLRRGIVGRAGFQGATLHQGQQRLSKNETSAPDYRLCTDITARLQQLDRQHISGNWRGRPGDAIVGKWTSPSLELRANGPIDLSDIALTGNIVVTAPKVYIAKDAQLQDILIFANEIHVQSGFQGRLQMFATDSIYIEPQCQLQYPSAAVLASTEEWGALILGEASTLHGLLMADASLIDPKAKNLSYTLIAAQAEVVGTVIVAENLDLKGTVTGHVNTGKFRLVTAATLYENYLLDATIQHEGLSPQYAMPLLQPGNPQCLEILKLPTQ